MATLAFTSCQKENLDTDFNSDPSAVRVNASVGEGINITRSNPMGDADKQKVFNEGDIISVSADDQTAVIYTLGGGKWNPATGTYLKWNTPRMLFTAYYPVTEGIDAQNFTLPTDQSDLEKITATDYMTFSDSIGDKPDSHSVDIVMGRKTARVIVHIAGLNDQYTEDYSVTAASVSGNTNGYANGTTKTGAVTVSAYKDTDFYALLTPTTLDGDATFITLTVTNGTTTHELTVKGIPGLEAGKSYTYNVAVGKNGITIGSVTVKDWGDETLISEDEAVIPPNALVDPITHTITVLKTGFLAADHITEALADGTVLAVKGEINDADVTTLTAATTLTTIDLREATYTGGQIPSATWDSALKRILIRYSDKGAYETAWSSVSDKLFYTGKEITHSSGVGCIVYDVNFQGYKLISKECYGVRDTKDWTVANSECIAKNGRLPKQNGDMNLILPLNEVTSVMKNSFETDKYYLFWCDDMHNGESDTRKTIAWNNGKQRFDMSGGRSISSLYQYFIVFDVE